MMNYVMLRNTALCNVRIIAEHDLASYSVSIKDFDLFSVLSVVIIVVVLVFVLWVSFSRGPSSWP